jgi:hypothetical protein
MRVCRFATTDEESARIAVAGRLTGRLPVASGSGAVFRQFCSGAVRIDIRIPESSGSIDFDSGKWPFSGGKLLIFPKNWVVFSRDSARASDNHRGNSPEWRPEKISRQGVSPAIGDRNKNYRATFSHSGDKPKSLIRALTAGHLNC